MAPSECSDERCSLLDNDPLHLSSYTNCLRSHTKHRGRWKYAILSISLISLLWMAALSTRAVPLLRVSTLESQGENHKEAVPIWEREPDFVFYLELMYIGMQLDGKQKTVLSFNGAGPQGPAFRVPLNSIVRFEVVNSLPDQGLTLHFHGVHQVGTPFFDGAHGVTQGAIPPMGGAMTYQFVAWPSGTHWYHSHVALQYADGAKGLFIVYDEDDSLESYYDAERYVMFYDWLPNLMSAEYYVLGQVFGNSMHVKDATGHHDMIDWVPAAGLVNGKGGLKGDEKGPKDKGFVLEAPIGHTLRVRLCFGGWLDKAAVYIDGHDMLVITKDGAHVKPVRTKKILMHPGERFDVLVTARPDAQIGQEYNIVFEIRDHAEFPIEKLNIRPDWTPGNRPFLDDPSLLVFTKMKGYLNATLRYVAAPYPSSVRSQLKPWHPSAVTDVVDTARDSFSTNPMGARLALDTTRSEAPPKTPIYRVSSKDRNTKGPVENRVVLPLIFSGGYHNPTTGEWVYPHTEKLTSKLMQSVGAQPFSISDAPLSKRVLMNNFWTINNNTWIDPVVPLYISKAKFGLSTARSFSTLVYDIPKKSIVDVVVVVHGNAGVIEEHPIHMHGNRFWVIFAAQMPVLPLPEMNDLAGHLDGLALNLDDPPYVDTYPVVTGYYYVFRFVASNPGFWHFHCHLLMHGVAGMQVALNVRQDEQPAPPKMYYDGQDLNGMLCPPS